MKKFVVLIAFLLLSTPFIMWFLQDQSELHIVIIDKTVPDSTYREHNGLTWLLNHEKIVKASGQPYETSSDYYGFMPLPDYQYQIRELASDLTDVDLIYIADTYGVFEDDFYGENLSGNRSEKIYGGMTVDEVSLITQYLHDHQATLVAEFNSFASPTTPEARAALTNLLSLEWDGWIGRYIQELDPTIVEEVPTWVIENYQAQTNTEWNFSGGGFILIHEDDTIVVLEDQVHVSSEGISVTFTEAGQALFGLKISPSYNYWFDIVTPHNAEDILAHYQWDLTNDGKQLLADYDIPASFAAITRSTTHGFTSYYFAGDYVDLEKVPAFYQMKGYATIKKWLTLDQRGRTEAFYWKTYVPMMKRILQLEKNKEIPTNTELSIYEDESGYYNAKVDGNTIQFFRDGTWEETLIKGVNLGISKPGTWPGETLITEDDYYRWFQMIGEMNANAIRVYTLHPPGFYRALERYNRQSDQPLYLFHGVWIDEEPLEETLDAFHPESLEPFKERITDVVDAIHGNLQLPERPGHASGTFTANVSPYVAGWILGIEWYPNMVLNTNEVYAGLGDFQGKHVYTNGAEPFEYWLAEIFDYTLDYELENYKWQRPISFTNWVTTDLLEHPSEPSLEEDLVGVDPNVIYLKEHIKTGQFASYHAYPYYPDFLNHDPDYLEFIDHRGQKNSYAAYLQDLHKAHRIPLLIAEFGVPSSRGLTHSNPYGWNQGFLSEQEQGEINASLFEDIVQEGLLGGLVFAWHDEWFKRTWNTMDLDSPYRRPYWSDAQTNEQNFGLLSFDRDKIKIDGDKTDWDGTPLYEQSDQPLQAVYVDHDERYLYLRIDYEDLDPFENMNTLVLLDIIENQGNTNVPFGTGVTVADGGIDFVIHLNGQETSRVLVDSYYDVFYYQYANQLKLIPELSYPSQKNNGVFHPIQYVISKKMLIPTTGEEIPFQAYETGLLRHGNANPEVATFDSLADFHVNHGMVELRLPWLLLNIKDPSLKEAFGDVWTDGLKASQFIEAIKLAVITYQPDDEGNAKEILSSLPAINENVLSELTTYSWENWEAPIYQERLKRSYYILQELFNNIKKSSRH